MRVAHLADIHLGFRRGNKITASGANQREVDVALAFKAAIDAVVAVKPDAVLLAGDLFDKPSPGNAAICFALDQFERLRAGLPDVPVVLIAGNHDVTKSSEGASILRAFRRFGVDMAIGCTESFAYSSLDLRVTAVPDFALRSEGVPPCPTGERYQVLLMHGKVHGIYPAHIDTDFAADDLAPAWSWVCLGDWHSMQRVAPRAYYSGALDYVSSNPWGELEDETRLGVSGKGWILADLDSGEASFQPVPLARQYHDLGILEGQDRTVTELNALIAERVGTVEIAGSVARLTVLNVSGDRDFRKALDWTAIHLWQKEALDFRIELVKPERVRTRVSRESLRRKSLPELLADHLARRQYTPGIDGAAVAKLGAGLLAAVADAEAETLGQRGAA